MAKGKENQGTSYTVSGNLRKHFSRQLVFGVWHTDADFEVVCRELKHATTTATAVKASLKKKAFAPFQTSSLLFHLLQFVKCYLANFSGVN